MTAWIFGLGAKASARRLAVLLLFSFTLASACSSSDPPGQATAPQSARNGEGPDQHNDATRNLARLRASAPRRLVGDPNHVGYTDPAPAIVAPNPLSRGVIGRPKIARLDRVRPALPDPLAVEREALAGPASRRLGLPPAERLGRPAVAVQLAAHRSDARARANWRRLRATFPDLLRDLAPEIQRADLGARGVFYRVRAGPFKFRAEAQGLCRQLRARGQDCLVVAP